MRVQKFLANLGLGSRREIEQWIKNGRIHTNSGAVQLGDKINPGDQIFLDGKRVVSDNCNVDTRVILYHKKVGEVSTYSDPLNRPTFLDALPKIDNGKWVSVGRLDINTSGLILFTNNGELANGLMHPRQQIERIYLCRVYGMVTSQMLNQLRSGVKSGNDFLKLNQVEYHKGKGLNQWFRISLIGGKNREIRRSWEAVDCQVNRLIRTRYGPIDLPKSLKAGSWLELNNTQVGTLIAIGLPEQKV